MRLVSTITSVCFLLFTSSASLNRDSHLSAGDKAYRELQCCHSGRYSVRNTEVHLITVDRTRIAARIKDVRQTAIDVHLDWRIYGLRRAGGEWLAGIKAWGQATVQPVPVRCASMRRGRFTARLST